MRTLTNARTMIIIGFTGREYAEVLQIIKKKIDKVGTGKSCKLNWLSSLKEMFLI